MNFRWIYDYSGGQVTDWGGHHPDIAQWGMGTELTGPVEIRNAAASSPKDPLWNTATDFYFEAVYDNGVTLIVSDKERRRRHLRGNRGLDLGGSRGHRRQAAIADRRPAARREPAVRQQRSFPQLGSTAFISRQETIAPIEIAHRSITIAHLGNISLRLGRDLKWDPAAERFIDDDAANAMLSRPMREPWKI